MCTLSLIKRGNKLIVTMNRDEYRERHEAPVHSSLQNGTAIYHPTDAQTGGTWAGINNHGVVLCLLNKYEVPTIDGATSRGTIIPQALAQKSMAAATHYLRTLNPTGFNGFDCVIANHQSGVLFSWDRVQYREQILTFDQSLMFTSSSERLAEVSQYRQQLFAQWQQQSPPLDSSHFHLRQAPNEAANAVLMSRQPTHTKSLVRFYLSPTAACFEYYDQSALKANTSLAHLRASYRWQGDTINGINTYE